MVVNSDNLFKSEFSFPNFTMGHKSLQAFDLEEEEASKKTEDAKAES